MAPNVNMPQSRNDFKVAIICALTLEAEMVELILDHDWKNSGKSFGKAAHDPNAYTTGVIEPHNVVLAHMPGMGSNSAAAVAAGLKTSFPEVKIAFVVGICGVVPEHPTTEEEIILGDVVISTTVVQYDFGREYPNGFRRKNNIEDSIGRANPEIRAYLSMLKTRKNRKELTAKLSEHLSKLQKSEDDLYRPNPAQDRLFKPDYQHRHHKPPASCNQCLPAYDTCSRSCDVLGCEDAYLVPRRRFNQPESDKPRIHFGIYGTANTVMKSGIKRDKINAEDDVIAFEMEGSGVWDTIPTIIIKSACDYADAHKQKDWQEYASASAASALKAVLERWEPPEQMLTQAIGGLSLGGPSNTSPPPLPPRISPQPGAANTVPQNPYQQNYLPPPPPPQTYLPPWDAYARTQQATYNNNAWQKLHGILTGQTQPAQPTYSHPNFIDSSYYGQPTQQPAHSPSPHLQQTPSPHPRPPGPPPLSEQDKMELDKELCTACGEGNLDRVIKLHKQGANLNNRRGTGYGQNTPLLAAATAWSQIERLCNDPIHRGSILIPQWQGMADGKWEVVQYLLDNGVNLNTLSAGPLRNEVNRVWRERASQR